MKDFDDQQHAKPDWDHAEFILFIGTSPAQSGNPLKRQARQLAKRRADENFSYVTVSSRLEMTFPLATQKRSFFYILQKIPCKGFQNPYNTPHTTTRCCGL